MAETLTQSMARHRALARVIKREERTTTGFDNPERIRYFRIKALKDEHYKLTIALLIQVPNQFVQQLIDQTFLK